jgi:hypothetical protein
MLFKQEKAVASKLLDADWLKSVFTGKSIWWSLDFLV